ncbi:hypothetical protein [Gemmatimonas sp.]|uniref:hypothetical protein n=1 Tax=Gemmatimonas sp. TaxID=1962908 RepID=UPI003569F649
MLGASRSRSAHARSGTGGAWRLHTPTPQASLLFRLVSDHLQRLQTGYDDRFAREYGPWRSVVARVADNFLACGVLDHGFAHIHCAARRRPDRPVSTAPPTPRGSPVHARQGTGAHSSPGPIEIPTPGG